MQSKSSKTANCKLILSILRAKAILGMAGKCAEGITTGYFWPLWDLKPDLVVLCTIATFAKSDNWANKDIWKQLVSNNAQFVFHS